MDDALNAPIKQSRLHEEVAERIRTLIINDSIRPGDRLPAERELSQRIGVSRVVIREAMRVLHAQGLITVKPGSGTYVQEIAPSHISDSISLFLRMRQSDNPYQELMEVRRTLEIDIAGMAAERATSEDIAAMEAAIVGMSEHQEDPDRFTEFDLAFHIALANATHNVLYNMLLHPIADLLLDFRRDAYEADASSAIEGGLKHHQEVLAFVRAKDAEGARQAMREHLEQAERVISNLTGKH